MRFAFSKRKPGPLSKTNCGLKDQIKTQDSHFTRSQLPWLPIVTGQLLIEGKGKALIRTHWDLGVFSLLAQQKKWKRMKKVSQKHRLISLASSFVPGPTTSRPCAIVWLSLEQRLPTSMDRYIVANLIDMFLLKWIKTDLGFLLIQSAFAPTVSAVSTLDLDRQILAKTGHQFHKNLDDYIRLITCHHRNACQWSHSVTKLHNHRVLLQFPYIAGTLLATISDSIDEY